MAILEGGIFSNPRGKTGGIVFGAARTRTGKKVTSRLLVPPSNPNTAAQQIQRGKFAEALAIVRLLGSSIYQSDFNRSIGQLPGFQSMTSIFLNSLDASDELNIIPPINLGSLHKPASMVYASALGSGSVKCTYSTELGINGTTLDVCVFICIDNEPAASPLEREVSATTLTTRTDGEASVIMAQASHTYSMFVYFRGIGTADGLLSPTDYGEAVSSA